MATKNQAQQSFEIKDLGFVSVISTNEQEEGAIVGGNRFSDFITKDVPGGFRRFGQGGKDGTRDKHGHNTPPRHDDLWYNLGYGVGGW